MMPATTLTTNTMSLLIPVAVPALKPRKPLNPVSLYLRELEDICDLPSDLAIREIVPLLSHLASDRTFLDSSLLPHAEATRGTGINSYAGVKDPYIAYRREGQDNSYALQLFVWPAGAASQIHDHSCWGAISCISGSLMEKRYDRIDDASTPNQAHLKKAWEQVWKSGQGISTLLPYDGGIHQVSNPTNATVLSLHIYGPMGAIDGRDYDPLHDYVCDRLVGD